MKDFEIKPGVSLGPFKLGSYVNDVLRQMQDAFLPERPEIDVLYSNEQPLGTEIILRSKTIGLQLRFEPTSQRLVCIEASNLAKMPLSYQNNVFSGPAEDSYMGSFIKVYGLFGPTYPGKYDPDVAHYVIKYQGLCIMFHIPEEFSELYEINDELPIELPNGASPSLSRLFVYSGFDLNVPVLPPLKGEEASNQRTRVLVDEKGTSIEVNGKKAALYLGATLQDVKTELGKPSKVYFKEDDKMRIHSPQVRGIRVDPNPNADGKSSVTFHAPQSSPPLEPQLNSTACFKSSDYFYNYYTLGIDVLFDKDAHTVKKVILHTNVPGHSEFSIYRKCAFVIHYHEKAKSQPSTRGSSRTANRNRNMNRNRSKGSPSRFLSRPRSPGAPITSESQWSDVEATLGSAGKPMVRDTGAVTNPFGASYLYAYDGLIFEVLKSGHIASVTLF